MVADGRALALASGSLRAIVMLDVLHHIPDVRKFFHEAARCLSPGGAVIMIEPWVSSWSKFIYTRFHHEPFQIESADWSFPEQGPLSGANGALPWIVFERDRALFEAEFPELRIEKIQPMMPFRYLVSGGVSMRSLMPRAATPFWRVMEKSLEPWMRHWAMFALVMLRRV
jgi:SAM-dependent methyltransferase